MSGEYIAIKWIKAIEDLVKQGLTRSTNKSWRKPSGSPSTFKKSGGGFMDFASDDEDETVSRRTSYLQKHRRRRSTLSVTSLKSEAAEVVSFEQCMLYI